MRDRPDRALGGGFWDEEQNTARVQGYTQRVNRINALEDEIEELSDEALKAKTEEFRSRLAAGETEDDLLEEAFAVVREAAWRAIDLRHYDVQLVGAMALHEGFLAGAHRARTAPPSAVLRSHPSSPARLGRDGHGRGQVPHVHLRGLPQRASRYGRHVPNPNPNPNPDPDPNPNPNPNR